MRPFSARFPATVFPAAPSAVPNTETKWTDSGGPVDKLYKVTIRGVTTFVGLNGRGATR